VGMTFMLMLLKYRGKDPSSVMVFWKDIALSRN
jgi:hypothetical protein